jgi:hypothetical protein
VVHFNGSGHVGEDVDFVRVVMSGWLNCCGLVFKIFAGKGAVGNEETSLRLYSKLYLSNGVICIENQMTDGYYV